MMGFSQTSTLVGHFVLSPRAREKRDRRDSRGSEREGQGRNRNETEETEETRNVSLRKHPYSNIHRKFHLKKTENFQIKNSDIFHIFAQKHRLWVLVRTASVRRF